MKTIVELATLKQPHPKKGDKRVLGIVVEDLGMFGKLPEYNALCQCLESRAKSGLAKYHTWLETNNGRDPLVDAFQEALDLVMYLAQEEEEGEHGSGDYSLTNRAVGLAIAIMNKLESRKGTNGG